MISQCLQNFIVKLVFGLLLQYALTSALSVMMVIWKIMQERPSLFRIAFRTALPGLFIQIKRDRKSRKIDFSKVVVRAWVERSVPVFVSSMDIQFSESDLNETGDVEERFALLDCWGKSKVYLIENIEILYRNNHVLKNIIDRLFGPGWWGEFYLGYHSISQVTLKVFLDFVFPILKSSSFVTLLYTFQIWIFWLQSRC